MCPFYWIPEHHSPALFRERIIRHFVNMHSTERRVAITDRSTKLRGGHGCISGRGKQMQCIFYMFDYDCMTDRPRLNYMSRSAALIRSMLTAPASPTIRFDRHVTRVLTDKGATFMWNADAPQAVNCLKVTTTWWATKDMAEIAFQECVMCSGNRM